MSRCRCAGPSAEPGRGRAVPVTRTSASPEDPSHVPALPAQVLPVLEVSPLLTPPAFLRLRLPQA